MSKNQLRRLRKNKSFKFSGSNKDLHSQPQYKGITLKIYTLTPKKPNSALRKVAKIKILSPTIKSTTPLYNSLNSPKSYKIIIAYIPNEKHTISIHNTVLVIPKKTKDLPGIKFRVLRYAKPTP